MGLFVVLDAGPTWLLSCRPGVPAADECREWLQGCEIVGDTVVLPAIVDYEVRRERIRVNATVDLRTPGATGRLRPVLGSVPPEDWSKTTSVTQNP